MKPSYLGHVGIIIASCCRCHILHPLFWQHFLILSQLLIFWSDFNLLQKLTSPIFHCKVQIATEFYFFSFFGSDYSLEFYYEVWWASFGLGLCRSLYTLTPVDMRILLTGLVMIRDMSRYSIKGKSIINLIIPIGNMISVGTSNQIIYTTILQFL